MTDAMTPPSKPPSQNSRPSSGMRRPSQKQRLQKPSKESEFIGYMVLGFGVLAVIAVAMIATNRFKGESKTTNVTTSQTEIMAKVEPKQEPEKIIQNNPDLQNRVAQDLLGNVQNNFAIGEQTYKEPDKRELYFNRQPKINIANIEGSWQAIVGKSTAVLQIGKGVYQIVMADPTQYSYRTYSSGTYKTIEDIVVFTPRADWPAPVPPANTDVQYRSITRAEFPVIVAIQGGKMLMQNPPSTEKRVYVPRALSLLSDPAQGYIAWQKVK